MPTTCDGKSLWKGNRNPVKLVDTVVARNSAVQPLSCFAAISPNTTTNPDPIPTRLNTTCTKVNMVILKPPLSFQQTLNVDLSVHAGTARCQACTLCPTAGRGQAVTSRPCNDRVSARGKSAVAISGSRRNALLCAWDTVFMLHPSNRAQSQLE